MKKEAKELLEAGISVIPTGENKLPLIEWDTYRYNFMDPGEMFRFNKAYGIAAVCGKISGGLECIDIDLKYDITGKGLEFYENVKNKNVVIQETPSGGLHVIYRCEEVGPNKKIAGRLATDQEKEKGLKYIYIIETRGEGGYFLIHPSPGYSVIKGSLYKIPTISKEEREEILETAYSYNEIVKEYIPPQKVSHGPGLSPFEDYDNQADVVSLLEKHGWKFVEKRNGKYFMRRPGSNNHQSGNWDEQRRWFTVFSPNTEFEVQKAYRPYAVFTVLECNGDFKEASRRLFDMGYGERKKIEPVQLPKVANEIDINEFISSPDEDWKWIKDFDNGKIPKGLVTGWPELDNYFRFKKSNFTIINGNPNVGKSVSIWFLDIISAVLHDWKHVIFTTENRSAFVRKKLSEFYMRKPTDLFLPSEEKKARDFIEDHFTIIKTKDGEYTYKDVLDLGYKIINRKYHETFLIDPYNSLLVDTESKIFKSGGKHEYDYQAATEFRKFCKETDCAIYLNAHAFTGAQRNRDKDKMPIAPRMEDTEGGGKFSNRADDFLTIHRLVGHPEKWNETQIHVRKIKETETGGKPTPYNSPFIAIMTKPWEFRDTSSRHPFDTDYTKPAFDISVSETGDFVFDDDDVPF